MHEENWIAFDWDEKKAKQNLRKHRVSFDEARSAFFDIEARLIPDPDHSEDEDRFVLLGMGERLRILVVCHCYREEDSVIRVISARKATRKEQRIYQEQRSR